MISAHDLDTVLTEGNAAYIAELYSRYLTDPSAVDQSWGDFFSALGDDTERVLAEISGPSWARETTQIVGAGEGYDVSCGKADPPAIASAPVAMAPVQPSPPPAHALNSESVRNASLDSIRALMVIRSYRVRGHLMAKLDPLGIALQEPHPELEPATYGFTEADMDRPIFIDNVLGLETATMRQIIDVCRKTYCGSIGVEFMHIQEPAQKQWIQYRIESARNTTQFTERGKHAIMERLIEAEGFEHYLHTKYVGTKRFGLDGGEP